jgi:gliding motility-associated-like protein
MVRDMQVSIAACDNQPPQIFTIMDTCVTAGQPLNIDVLVTDPNSSQVTLSATGAPLLLSNSPATIQSASGTPPITSQLVWNTNCSHVKKNKYSITLKATDNGPIINLVSFKTIYITIVAPKPENLVATPQGNTITLNWNRETCTNAIGYKIFKRTNSQFFEPDICETGLPQYAGYQQIGITNSISDTTFTDDGSVLPIYHGNEYCYRVFAFFADGAESYVSDEACAYITNDAPFITNVDVLETSLTNGKINVKWLAPPEIDTNLVLPPYFFKLYRSSSASSNFVEMATFTFEQEYTFDDINLNTEEYTYYYKIEFWGQGEFVPIVAETSDPASSIYLKITPTDNALKLNWSCKVPWQNVAYDILKYNSTLDQFDSIATTTAQSFTDVNLLNGVEYCYIVRSVGGYFTPDTLFPFYNHSQRVCNTPIDNLPPDLPEVNITTDCEEVLITWGYDNDTSFLDVFKYYIFYRPNYQSDYYIIDSLLGSDEPCYPYFCEIVLENRPHITGCYRMAMIDSVGNLSEMTPEVCFDVEDCYTYTLPNVFTPNNDGFNDLWKPFPYTNVEVIDLIVFNRWGRKVFQTSNPDINWDGKDYLSNEPVSDGTFYYSCEINLQTLNGPKKKPLHGTVIILRENK